MVGNRPVFGPPPPPSPPRFLIDCDEDEEDLSFDEDRSDGSYVGGPVPFPDDRAGGPTLRPRHTERGVNPLGPSTSPLTPVRHAHGGLKPPGLSTSLTPVYPARGAAPQPGSRAHAPPSPVNHPSTSLHPPGQYLAPSTQATSHPSTLAPSHPQSKHLARNSGPTGPVAGPPLEASRHAHDGNPTGTGAGPLLRRPRGRPPKPGPPLPTTKPPSALDGRPSLVPDRHTMAMRPPSPSPPHSEDFYDNMDHSDIDMDAVDHLFAPNRTTNPQQAPILPPSSFQLWQNMRKTQTPQGVLISFEDQKKLTAVLEEEHLSVLQLAQQQKIFQKKIESFMASLESKIDNIEINRNYLPDPHVGPTPLSDQPTNPWSGPINRRVMSKRAGPPHLNRNTPAPPPNRVINQFRPSSFIIRKVPDSTPFNNLSAEDIVKKSNEVLTTLNAVTSDNTPIRIRAVSILKSGDIKFFSQSRPITSWLLANKHTWTHLCDPSLITRPTVFPIIIHSVPVDFNPDSPDHVLDLCHTNNLDPYSISRARWLGNPSSKKKIHGSIVIDFRDKSLASQIEKGGLFYQSHYMRGAHYIKGPTQCFNCLEVGHTFKFCKNPPFCNKCGEQHNTNDCQEFETDSIQCHKCIKHYQKQHPESIDNLDTDNLQFRHSSMGALCPLRHNQRRQGASNL